MLYPIEPQAHCDAVVGLELRIAADLGFQFSNALRALELDIEISNPQCGTLLNFQQSATLLTRSNPINIMKLNL